MNASSSLQQRKIFGHLSIVVGNMLQIAGIAAPCAALALARSVQPRPAVFAAAMLIAAWLLLYILLPRHRAGQSGAFSAFVSPSTPSEEPAILKGTPPAFVGVRTSTLLRRAN
jgi:hypothetical protein